MMMSPRFESHAKPLHASMIEYGDIVTDSGSSSCGVHTSAKRLALTRTQLFSGICTISGSIGDDNAYGGGLPCACVIAGSASAVMSARQPVATRAGNVIAVPFMVAAVQVESRKNVRMPTHWQAVRATRARTRRHHPARCGAG